MLQRHRLLHAQRQTLAAQYDGQQEQHTRQPQDVATVHQQVQDRPIDMVPSCLPPVPREMLGQRPQSSNQPFTAHAAARLGFPRSTMTNYANTTQQFTPQPSSRNPTPNALNPLPPRSAPPPKQVPAPPQNLTTAQARPNNPQSSFSPARQNETTERIRIQQQRTSDAAQRAHKRKALLKDPHVNYRNYIEFLDYFPLRRGEYPNPYLLGLLANQRLPIEPTSDRAIAIRFAKVHWEEYWELKDLDYVLERARKAGFKTSRERRKVLRSSTGCRSL